MQIILKRTSVIIIPLVLLSFFYIPCRGDNFLGFREEFGGDTSKHRVSVSPSFYGEIVDSITNVYCSSFQLAWNALRKEIFKGPIVLDKSISWVDLLNRDVNTKSLSEEYFTVHSGFGSGGVLLKFQQDLLDKFGYHYTPRITVSNSSLYSFSFMRKKVGFKWHFNELLNEKLKFDGGANVSWFGMYSGWNVDDAERTVKIHDYISDDDFILQLEVDKGDEIFFAKIEPGKTFAQTYQDVINRVNKGNISAISNKDEIKIPYLKFHLENEFAEINGARILNENYGKYSFDRSIQIIDFDLNESGISVESISEIISVFGMPKKVVPRKLILDRPFLVIMKEKTLNAPYLLIWVGNDELMRRR